MQILKATKYASYMTCWSEISTYRLFFQLPKNPSKRQDDMI